jgi:RNA polymerase sigma-70 factor (ECF subfamily)
MKRIETGEFIVAEPTADCVKRAQAGDPQALTELIMGQQHYVYSIAMSVLHQPDDAADLTQEAFIRLMRVLPQYSGESRFTTWLYRLVVNLCRDELRRRGRQVQLAPVTEDSDEQSVNPLDIIADDDRAADPLRALGDNELRAAVRHALGQLEEHYRLSLTLYYFDDLKYTDIAEILDVPLNTVKSYIRRGKERLATLLDEYNEDGAAPQYMPTPPVVPSRATSPQQRFAFGGAS